jgi:hypothetical protein
VHSLYGLHSFATHKGVALLNLTLMRLSENTENCHCEALFAEACFLGAQSHDKTAEIASSQKTLLAMTVISSSRTHSYLHDIVILLIVTALSNT